MYSLRQSPVYYENLDQPHVLIMARPPQLRHGQKQDIALVTITAAALRGLEDGTAHPPTWKTFWGST